MPSVRNSSQEQCHIEPVDVSNATVCLIRDKLVVEITSPIESFKLFSGYQIEQVMFSFRITTQEQCHIEAVDVSNATVCLIGNK